MQPLVFEGLSHARAVGSSNVRLRATARQKPVVLRAFDNSRMPSLRNWLLAIVYCTEANKKLKAMARLRRSTLRKSWDAVVWEAPSVVECARSRAAHSLCKHASHENIGPRPQTRGPMIEFLISERPSWQGLQPHQPRAHPCCRVTDALSPVAARARSACLAVGVLGWPSVPHINPMQS